ncbi:hypothetical protein V7128_07230 [Neobacillus vireti]|uniref:hypothetical protein n=1 Tax=Neobacillus vireti TaxID=220686 RepID=UPI003000C805
MLSGCGQEIGDKIILKKDVAGANSIKDFNDAIKAIDEGSKEDITLYTKEFSEGDEVKILDIKGKMCFIKDLDNEVEGTMWTTCSSL